MLHKFTHVLVNSQLGSRQGQLGKTAVTKSGAYIVPMDRKTTEYRLEAGKIVLFFFLFNVQAVPPYFTSLPVGSRLITSL